MSGGVDSTVCTALLTAAIGAERVVGVHIDSGFMRKNESSNVKEALEALGLKLHGRQSGLRPSPMMLRSISFLSPMHHCAVSPHTPFPHSGQCGSDVLHSSDHCDIQRDI